MSRARVGVMACLVACAVAGCGGKILEEPAPDSAKQPAEREPEIVLPNPFHMGDVWRGTYTCAQGLTQLELRIIAMHDDVIDDALFYFDWVEGNASGLFHMRGTYNPLAGTATFEPESWVEKPGSNWVTVGMTGPANESYFTGQIHGPKCTTFSLTEAVE